MTYDYRVQTCEQFAVALEYLSPLPFVLLSSFSLSFMSCVLFVGASACCRESLLLTDIPEQRIFIGVEKAFLLTLQARVSTDWEIFLRE